MIILNAVLGFFLKIFKKIKRIIQRKILIITNPRPLLRKRLEKRQLIDELSGSIVREKRIPPRFIWKVMIAEKSLREPALQVFLNFSELSLDDIFNAAENIPIEFPQSEKDELENILWAKAKEMGLMAEDLVEIIIGELLFREKALKELEERIKNSNIRKNRAKEFLKRLIDEIPELRIPMCELIMKKLEPSTTELKKLLDSPWMKYLPLLAQKIETMARKTYEKEKAEKKFEAGVEKKIENWLKRISQL